MAIKIRICILILLMVFTPACSYINKNRTYSDFDAAKPVDIRRNSVRPGLYQMGNELDMDQFESLVQSNADAKKALSRADIWYYTAWVLAIGGGTGILLADRASKFWAGVAVLGLARGASAMSNRNIYKAGEAHNSAFVSFKVKEF